MEISIILCAAILPAFLLVVYIWWRDKYQREPFSQIIRGVVFGIVAAGIAACVELLVQLLGIVSPEPSNLVSAVWTAFAGAAIPEECAKIFMLALLLRHNRYFDERFDGIVYACAVGMGFAGTENILYLLSNINEWETVAIQRAVFAVPGHFLFAVAMGYCYSLVYFGDVSWRKQGRILWLPILLHGIYDALLFMAHIGTILSGVLLIAFYVFCFTLFRYGQKSIREHIQRDENDPNQIAFWRKKSSKH